MTTLSSWEGEIVFDEEGIYDLEGQVGNSLGSYTREINSVFVTRRQTISDADTAALLNGVQISVFERDVETNRFDLWNGEALGQQNPFVVDESFAVVLPKGDFYLEVSLNGYYTATSLITTIEDTTVVTADVLLQAQGNLGERLIALVSTQNATNNFELSVSPIPPIRLLELEEVVPAIPVTSLTNPSPVNVYDVIDGDKPVILMTYSSWNTLSQEQVEIFINVASELGEDYEFLPISTMEPDNVNLTYLGRGDYELEFYKPVYDFFDDYKIISLPQFFLMDPNLRLKEIVVGPQAEEDLRDIIIEILEPTLPNQ